jgi:hypothetical protein
MLVNPWLDWQQELRSRGAAKVVVNLTGRRKAFCKRTSQDVRERAAFGAFHDGSIGAQPR